MQVVHHPDAAYADAMALHIGAHVDQDRPDRRGEAREGVARRSSSSATRRATRARSSRTPGAPAALKADAEAAGIDLYVHAPYPINVATTNNRIRIPGRKLLQQHLTAAAEIGAKGVIVHGGHVLKDDDPAIGFDNWRKCIDGLDMPVPLLIENTAGGDNAMARRLEAIARLWDAIGRAERRRHRRLLPRHLPRPRRRQRAGDRRRPGARDHRPHRPRARQRLPRRVRLRRRPARELRRPATSRATPWPRSSARPVRPVVCETPGGREGQAADIAWLR